MRRNAIIWSLLFTIAILLIGWFDPQLYHFPRCPFLTLTGFKCPGCGSQRAIHHLMHGHIALAANYNWLFLPGIIYSGSGFLLSAFYPSKWPAIQHKWFGKTAAYVALVIIVAFWIGRNIF